MRYAHLGCWRDLQQCVKKSLTLGQSLETYVDENQDFSSCTLDWANNTFDVGAEALYHNKRFFVRGEYRHKLVTKKRDSKTLFEASNDNIDILGLAQCLGGCQPPAHQPLQRWIC